MADAGHDMTDALLKETERKVKREYERAYRETQRKLKAYWKDIEGQAAKQRELLNAGKISQKDYDDWMLRHAAMGKRWEDMRDNLAQDYYNYNQVARSIVKGYQPEVYALNHNYATYQVEHSGGIDTAYTLYDKQTVERLIREDQVLMPDPSPRKKAQIARNKAMQWNKQALQSALTQGILQGESIPDIADRIARTVSVRNYNDSVRYARTMFTSAENAGRYDGYRRADKMGIDLTIEWSATLDGRTRHDHRMMHGQRRNVDEPFETPDGYKIYYPADCTGESNAPQSEIWNCRCTLLAWVKGFERDTVKSSPKMGEMSFEEWQHEKEPKTISRENEKFIGTGNATREKASSDWFEYENANAMAEFIRTGVMPKTDINGDVLSEARRVELAHEANLIQEIGEKTRTNEKTLYRGMVMDMDEVRAITPRDEYIFDTLSAATPDKKVASIYTDVENAGGDGVPVIFEIQKPDGIYGFKRDEIETVLPRGSTFKVVRNYMDEDGVIHVSLYSKKGKNVRKME